MPLLPRLPRRRWRQQRPVDPPPLRRRPRRLQDAEAPGPARRRVGVVVFQLVLLVLAVAPVVLAADEPLSLPSAAAEDPGGDGEGGGREGRGGAHLVQAVLEVVAPVLQASDVGAEAAEKEELTEML